MQISKKIANRLNEQVKNEMFASLTYLQMAFVLESWNLKVFAGWFYKQSEEEKGHAMRISRYLLDQGAEVKLQAIPEPKLVYKNIVEIFETALEHEKKVTKQVHEIVEMSRTEKDYATDNYIQWKVAEQVEEVNSVSELLNMVKGVKTQAELYLLETRMVKVVAERE
jgi:ferritin